MYGTWHLLQIILLTVIHSYYKILQPYHSFTLKCVLIHCIRNLIHMNNLCVWFNIVRLRNNDEICTQYLCWFCECEYHFLEFNHEDGLLYFLGLQNIQKSWAIFTCCAKYCAKFIFIEPVKDIKHNRNLSVKKFVVE